MPDALWIPVTGMVPTPRLPLAAGEAVCPASQRQTEQRHPGGSWPAIERRLRVGSLLPAKAQPDREGRLRRFRRNNPEGFLLEHGMRLLTFKLRWAAGGVAEPS